MSRYIILFVILLAILLAHHSATAQSYDGEVTGTLSGALHKYSGEFTDDLWGLGGTASLQYTPIARLQIEARFGLGEYRWKVNPSDFERYPTYFGANADYGDFYPGTTTTIEPENESRLTTIDLLVNYIIVDNIPAQPFISAGVGWASFSPSNNEEHDALPNNGAGVYTGSTVSIPVGGGVRIPFLPRVGLILRGEYRFVFSEWLDDVNFEGGNDGITSITAGLTYTFNEPPAPVRRYVSEDEAVYYRHHEEEMDGHADSLHAAPDTTEATTASPKADTTATQAPLPEDTTATPATTAAPIKRCPPGLTRICVEDDKSVCVDTTFVPGRDRIKWEDGMVYDPTDPGHLRPLKDIGATDPCYAHVIRQVGNGWYHCIDCCFERLKVGTDLIYNLLEEGTLAKGEGPFKPDDCPDCATVVSEGK